MFADFRVHGLNTTFFQCFHHPVFTYLQEKKEEGLPPDFLWSLVALASLMRLSSLKAAHVAVGECRVSRNPGRPSCSTHVRESPRTWGTRPGARLGGKPEKRRTKCPPPQTELKSFISLLTRHRPVSSFGMTNKGASCAVVSHSSQNRA